MGNRLLDQSRKVSISVPAVHLVDPSRQTTSCCRQSQSTVWFSAFLLSYHSVVKWSRHQKWTNRFPRHRCTSCQVKTISTQRCRYGWGPQFRGEEQLQTFHFVSDEYPTGSEARVYHMNSQFSPPPPPPSFSFSPGIGCSTKNQLSFTGTRLPQSHTSRFEHVFLPWIWLLRFSLA